MAKNKQRIRNPKERQEQIVNCARKLFYKFGYDKTSVSDIAEGVALEKAAIYHYFKSKDEILFKIIDNFLDGLIENYQKNWKIKEDIRKRLVKMVSLQISFLAQKHMDTVILIRETKSLPSNLKAKIREKEKKYLNLFAQDLNILSKIHKVEIPDSQTLGLMFLGIASTVAERLKPRIKDKEKETERITEFFLAGIFRTPYLKKSRNINIQ